MKYKILKDQSIQWKGRTLYRIQALKDFGDVKTGDIGGYVQHEDTLSQEGECWVYHTAKVYDAHVYGTTRVNGNALLNN